MTNPRTIKRLSLDVEATQHSFIKMFALKNDINVSVIVRAMIYQLETDPDFANEIIDLIFSVPEADVEEVEPEDDDKKRFEQEVAATVGATASTQWESIDSEPDF